jgi:hypothetical protein
MDRIRLPWALTASLCLLGMIAVAQAGPLVRACPAQPSGTGFGACSNSTWSVPASQLVIDVLRANVASDVWITPAQLVAGDRVFACTDPTVTAGPFKLCPTPLTGQTSNWLDASKVSFDSIPPSAAGQIDWSWAAPTANSDGTALTDLAGYHLYVRAQAVSVYPAPFVLPATAVDDLLKNLSGTQCAQIAAFNATGAEGIISDEVCATPSIKASVPAKIVLTVKAPQ